MCVCVCVCVCVYVCVIRYLNCHLFECLWIHEEGVCKWLSLFRLVRH